MIHRLHWAGRLLQFAPPPMLEGCTPGSPPATPTTCPALNREIRALHDLARTGEIPVDVADRQLNTYLLAAGRPLPGIQPRLLLLPIADAPHHSLLPDLGYVVHRILAQAPLPGSLSAAIEHCLPLLRHSAQPVTYEDSQGVFLNLTLALLLGLYPGSAVKRPCFEGRARLFARVHDLLTATPERQTAFCLANSSVVHLACMEYVTRVLPTNIPSQTAFIHERDPAMVAYFRRVPALCDELRQALDNADTPGWPQIQSLAAGMVERVARLKRSSGSQAPRETLLTDHVPPSTQADLSAHWSVPRLQGCPSPDEYRVLGHGLGLQGRLLWHIQREVQVRLLDYLTSVQGLTPNPPPSAGIPFAGQPEANAACRPQSGRPGIHSPDLPADAPLPLPALRAPTQDLPCPEAAAGHHPADPHLLRLRGHRRHVHRHAGPGPAAQAAELPSLPFLRANPAVPGGG